MVFSKAHMQRARGRREQLLKCVKQAIDIMSIIVAYMRRMLARVSGLSQGPMRWGGTSRVLSMDSMGSSFGMPVYTIRSVLIINGLIIVLTFVYTWSIILACSREMQGDWITRR